MAQYDNRRIWDRVSNFRYPQDDSQRFGSDRRRNQRPDRASLFTVPTAPDTYTFVDVFSITDSIKKLDTYTFVETFSVTTPTPAGSEVWFTSPKHSLTFTSPLHSMVFKSDKSKVKTFTSLAHGKTFLSTIRNEKEIW